MRACFVCGASVRTGVQEQRKIERANRAPQRATSHHARGIMPVQYPEVRQAASYLGWRFRLSVKEANKQDGEYQTLLLTARLPSFSLLLETCEGPNVHLSCLYCSKQHTVAYKMPRKAKKSKRLIQFFRNWYPAK